jgi:DMSO/TMAO reductase YedYZ molybdopterin-dependent catalytic subunit
MSHPSSKLRIAGVFAAAAGLGVGELVSALLADGRSPVVAVAEQVIDTTPGGVSRAVIELLGTSDKPFLITMVVAITLALGALTGALRLAKPRAAGAIVGTAGLVGAGALLVGHDAPVVAILAPALATATTWVVLSALAALAVDQPYGPLQPQALGRRTFLVGTATAASVAAVGVAAGRRLDRAGAAADRAAVQLPAPALAAEGVPTGVDFGIAGLTPWRTPNNRFYRIDTAVLVPQVHTDDWSLRIHGKVDHELRLTYDELLARPQVEADITLSCVSNGVGGSLVGTARWQGVLLADLLDEVGIHPDGDQLVGRSVDGFTVGFPTALARDGRQALVAVGMNGEPLPVVHGFPARLVVPGLYGYVSATKWLSEIELTGWDDFDAYWIDRGWSKVAPIKIASRIDRPRYDTKIDAGPNVVAGVAWVQHRGIAKVEVRVDKGPWHEAELALEPSVDTWRQWRWTWDATPGKHLLEVRATATDGEVQTKKVQDVFPDGASGWHSAYVRVRR